VAVLFADPAGYPALSQELDAEEVHALLGRFFERADRKRLAFNLSLPAVEVGPGRRNEPLIAVRPGLRALQSPCGNEVDDAAGRRR
jgi:hypothetical protein